MPKSTARRVPVRLMAPFSMRCGSCHGFIAVGTKFNARKLRVGEYSGVPIVRLQFRCAECGAEITLETNPKSGDYKIENATRSIEPRKQIGLAEGEIHEEVRVKREESIGNKVSGDGDGRSSEEKVVKGLKLALPTRRRVVLDDTNDTNDTNDTK